MRWLFSVVSIKDLVVQKNETIANQMIFVYVLCKFKPQQGESICLHTDAAGVSVLAGFAGCFQDLVVWLFVPTF